MHLSKFHVLSRVTQVIAVTMAQRAVSNPSAVPCKRLLAVSGDDVRKNDVIVCGAPHSSKTHILYFGGDVQDYKEKMCLNNPAYDYWDLETTARILQQRFPNSAVFVIKPSVMYLNTFSVYKNFLSFDQEGRPDFFYVCGAISHLKSLYKNAIKQMNEEMKTEIDVYTNSSQSESQCAANFNPTPELVLIGFSKGCVVVNQIMFELKIYRTLKEEFLDWITSIYWLDGGHTGGNNAYITDEDTLNDIVNLNKKLFVHVTPYQVDDPMRTWIGKEEATFVDLLKKKGADITEQKHFADQPASILNHFKVLTVF